MGEYALLKFLIVIMTGEERPLPDSELHNSIFGNFLAFSSSHTVLVITLVNAYLAIFLFRGDYADFERGWFFIVGAFR